MKSLSTRINNLRYRKTKIVDTLTSGNFFVPIGWMCWVSTSISMYIHLPETGNGIHWPEGSPESKFISSFIANLITGVMMWPMASAAAFFIISAIVSGVMNVRINQLLRKKVVETDFNDFMSNCRNNSRGRK